MFPTLSWLNGMTTMRIWHPRGPDKTEVWAFCITDKAAPQHIKEAMELNACRAFGPAGFAEADDGENWIEIQKVLRGYKARKSKLIMEMGLGNENTVRMVFRVLPIMFSLKQQRVACIATGQTY